jgi:uncharacterized repeat protein (TIGR03809 family)
MTHQTDVARGRDIIARWCDLAEQRLEHLTELFETGRWRRYHSELAFLENIKEAKSAVETWRDLSLREASRDHSSGDVCWLGQGRAMRPRGEARRDPAPRFSTQALRFPIEPLPAFSIAAQALPVSSVETAAVPAINASTVNAPEVNARAIDMPSFGPDLRPGLEHEEFRLNGTLPAVPEAAGNEVMPGGKKEPDYLHEPTLDLAVMQLRYPLLRNAL